ncbi:MAG: DUF447 domain-containing protein [Pirellulales bacterium]
MILEGIVTTRNPDRSVNISPMGPRVDAAMEQLLLRPYQTSTTYQNLKRTGEGVLHVTDDVLLLAQAAVGQPDPPPTMRDARAVDGAILADACRWYAFRVESLDDRQERTEIIARVIEQGTIREFFGFNRGKHAVVEAAILATRTAFLTADEIQREFERLAVLVEKTGGPRESEAFEFLKQYVEGKGCRG